jgi:hypothetical protein
MHAASQVYNVLILLLSAHYWGKDIDIMHRLGALHYDFHGASCVTEVWRDGRRRLDDTAYYTLRTTSYQATPQLTLRHVFQIDETRWQDKDVWRLCSTQERVRTQEDLALSALSSYLPFHIVNSHRPTCQGLNSIVTYLPWTIKARALAP